MKWDIGKEEESNLPRLLDGMGDWISGKKTICLNELIEKSGLRMELYLQKEEETLIKLLETTIK